MKILMAVALLLSISFTVQATPLDCREQGNKYTINLSTDHHVAQILYDRNRVQFGELQCRAGTDRFDRRSDLYCTSRNVADAGFTAHFVQMDGARYVHLSEISFIGVRYITTLPCYPKR